MKYLFYLLNYLLSFLFDIYYFFFGSFRKRILGFSYYRKAKLYPDYLKNGAMVESVKFLAQKYCKGRGVDIGAGKWSLSRARTIEDASQENAYTIREKDRSMDFVFSSHTLEHLKNWQNALKEWHRVLKINGILFLYLPHPCCQMWQKKVLKQHKWSPNPKVLSEFLTRELGMRIIEISFLPDGYLSFVVIAEKL
jgi:SAM-dependent methyltransferase